MNRNLIVILFVLIIGGGISALVIYFNQFVPEYDWHQSYDKDSEEPYGLHLFYQLMENQESEMTVINNDFYNTLDTNETNATYIVFEDYLHIDSLKAEHLLKFVEKGNNALLVANYSPLDVLCNFLPKTDTIYDYDYVYDSLVSVNFVNPLASSSEKLNFHHQFLKDTTATYWMGYTLSYFEDSLQLYGMNPISYIQDTLVNSFRVQLGEGELIVHANPILFTNYNIIKKEGLDHSNNILSHLSDGTIYWDETSKYPESSFNGRRGAENNPLQFLFSDYRLRWGWYLFLVAVVFYLLFRSKREQRIIPILPKNSNTSIAYVKAIGILYFQKGEHKIIADEMYTLFLADVRSKYHFSTNLEEAKLIEQIVTRSAIEQEKIEALFKHFRKVRFSPIANSKDLINLHHSIEFYHKNSK